MSKERLHIACVQMRSGLKRQANMADTAELIAQAAGHGAQLIATPEMTNVVDRKPRRLFEEIPDEQGLEEIAFFSGEARRHCVHLLIGSMAVALEKTFGQRLAANRSYLFAPDGKVAATYDKLHMFDVDLPDGESWKESSIYGAGDRAVTVQAGPVKLGLSICYDVRFPHLYRAMAQDGADLLAVPAAFTRQTGRAHWEVLLRARAIETGSFVFAPAQGGDHEDGRETWGHSMIINPWGKVLAVKEDDEPGVVSAEIDLAEVARARAAIPNLGLEKAFKVNDI